MRYWFVVAFIAALFLGSPAANATVDVAIDLTHQRMIVSSSSGTYSWPISSGRAGYPTPTGTFHSQALYRMVYSKPYGNAPMPHSIFFTGGYAIHATSATGALGHPASHGCVRLAPANAAALFQMVKAEGAQITISGAPPAPIVAQGTRAKGAKYAHRSHGKGTKYAHAAKSKHHVAGRATTRPAQPQPQPPAQDFFGLFAGT